MLGLNPGAEPEAVKHAFRNLVKQWHPDRHQQRSALEQHRAEERFKAISLAYRRIVGGWDLETREKSRGVRQARDGSSSPSPGHQGTAAPPGRASCESSSRINDSRESRLASIGAVLRSMQRIISSWGPLPLRALWAMGILLLAVNLVPWERSVRVSPTESRPRGDLTSTHSPWPSGDRGGGDSQEPAAPESAGAPKLPSTPEGSPGKPVEPPIAFEPPRSSFTLGATPEEVRAIQGPPDRTRGQTWVYGLSDLTFRDGRLVRYNNFGGELRVRMGPPEGPPVAADQWFSLGSTQDEVLRVQGTPTRVEGSKWYYGFSEVSFRNGRVDGFDNYFGSLKVRMQPAVQPVEAMRTTFTLGSSMDEVLAVQGTPTSVRGNLWGYDFSSVLFRHGRVQNVVDTGGVLRFVPPERRSERP